VIAPHAIQQVKDAARVEEVVGEFVALKRKGPRFLGLCPFHNEKTPSFNVSPTWASTSASVAARAAIASPSCRNTSTSATWSHPVAGQAVQHRPAGRGAEPEQQLEQSERESLAVVQQWALNWSVEQLWNTDEGKRIGLSYFHERGFTDATIKSSNWATCPEQGNAFATAAIANGFNPDMLEKAGWIKRRDDGNGPGTSSLGASPSRSLVSAASPSPSVRAR
jgi:DNA primase